MNQECDEMLNVNSTLTLAVQAMLETSILHMGHRTYTHLLFEDFND